MLDAVPWREENSVGIVGTEQKGQTMDEKRLGADEAALKQPEDAIKDLEPDEHEADAVVGGGLDGESQDDKHKN